MVRKKYTLNYPPKNYPLRTFNLLLTHLLTYIFLWVLPNNNRVHLFHLVIYPLSVHYMSFSYNHHWNFLLVRHLWPHFCCLTFSPPHILDNFFIFHSFLFSTIKLWLKKTHSIDERMKYMNKSLRLILLCPFVLLIKEIQWYCPQRCAYMEPNQSFQSLFSNSYSQIKIPFPHLYIRIPSRIGRFIYIRI